MRHVCTEREIEKEKEKECLFELKPLVRKSMYKKHILIVKNKSNL
jgi:hypothetical protein